MPKKKHKMIFEYPTENITGLIGFIQYTNTFVNGLLGVGILVIVGMVAFLTTKAYSWERALGFSGFIVLISAILLRIIGLITNAVLVICVIGFALIGIALLRERNVEEP